MHGAWHPYCSCGSAKITEIPKFMKSKALILTAAFVLGLTAQSKAAFISIDDSDLNNITITAGDFENGFYVNGNLLTTGLGGSGSITLADGGHGYSGSWIDLGLSSGSQNLFFADTSNPTDVTSGVVLTASSNGYYGSIVGSFGGYTGSVYFTGSPTFAQDGGTQSGGFPYLSYSFTSESVGSVPDSAATIAMLGGAFIGLAALRRRFVS